MEQHLEKARVAAGGYAPASEASPLVYGMIGMALVRVSIWLRKKRKGRRVDAYQAELVRLGAGRRS